MFPTTFKAFCKQRVRWRWLPRPSTLVSAALGENSVVAFSFAVTWFFLSRALRNVAHLRTRPSDVWLLPLVTLVIVLVALPIKAYAFVTMNKQGWLTRHANQIGGDGQNAASLVRGQSNGPR